VLIFSNLASRSWNKPQKLRETSPKLDDGMRTLSIIGANGIYNAPTSVVDDGPAGTDNPLWIDQKYKGLTFLQFLKWKSASLFKSNIGLRRAAL
jgi:hypothetical protein